MTTQNRINITTVVIVGLACLFVLPGLAQAGYNVSGYILNPYTGEGIPYVCVCIPTLGICDYTDANGYYNFTNISDGTYTMKACIAIFQCNTSSLVVNGAHITNNNITLTHYREMASESDKAPYLDEAAFEMLMDSMGIPYYEGQYGIYNESMHPWTWDENECANVSNSTFYEFNFSIFAYAIALPFTAIMGNLFFVFLFGIPFLMMWLRQESMNVPLALGIILAAGIFMFLPPEYVISAMGIMALAIVGAIYLVFKERS